MDLKKVSTKELVDELATREAVQKIVIGPYEDYSMTIDNKEIKGGGPVVILRIWD